MKELTEKQREDLAEMEKELRSYEEFFEENRAFSACILIEDYDRESVQRFMDEYKESGFGFSIEYLACPWEYPKRFLGSNVSYYRHRNDTKTYLTVLNKKEVEQRHEVAEARKRYQEFQDLVEKEKAVRRNQRKSKIMKMLGLE